MHNSRIFLLLAGLSLVASPVSAELKNNQLADLVIGQQDFSSASTGCTAQRFKRIRDICTNGRRLILSDASNNRILIWNSIPAQNDTPADVVVGQTDFTSNSSGITASKFYSNAGAFTNTLAVATDGKRLFVGDNWNSRVLIFNSIPTENGASADVVVGASDFTSEGDINLPWGVSSDGKRLIVAEAENNRVRIYDPVPTANGIETYIVVGQPDLTTTTSGCAANKLSRPRFAYSDGKRLFVADTANNRVLIWNSIPTATGTPADVVVGQPDFTSNAARAIGADTVTDSKQVFSDGKKLFICDSYRVLIFDSIPTQNNASADFVLGQKDFVSTDNSDPRAPGSTWSIVSSGKQLFITDTTDTRVLIFNIGSSSIQLGPQFDQGKAVLGKAFNDINGNGIQDEDEEGIEGVKIVSDTGIYAITDEDGKYHFPYIETGQRLLKIDPVTLPDQSIITTDSPYRIIVTKGVLSKVSFGVKLPAQNQQAAEAKSGPLLKVSVSEDPLLLKPRLAVSHRLEKEKVVFSIDCNYFLFIEKAKLNIYDTNLKLIKSLELSKPLPAVCYLEREDFSLQEASYYYQFLVYDAKGNEDRTGMGRLEIR